MAKCTDEPPNLGNRMSSRQALDVHRSGAHTNPRHHQPVPSQYSSDGSWVRGKKGYGLVVERREKAQIFLGVMSC